MKKTLKKLLLDTPETYYWMGFIMADGTFVGNRLKLGLSIKDEDLLLRLYNFLGCTNTIRITDQACEFQMMDTHTVPILKDKFDINKRKTYNPPKSLQWMDKDLLSSFIIGFIDGDGCIKKQTNREDPALSIQIHSAWLSVLTEMINHICQLSGFNTPQPKLNGAGYAHVCISNHQILKKLKLEVLRLGLPVLNRKWSLINETFINRSERASNSIIEVKKLLSLGYTNGMICDELDLKPSALSNIQIRNGMKSLRYGEAKLIRVGRS